MFSRKSFNKTTGRTYLSIIHGYWDAASKQSCARAIKKIGYLDELEKEYVDPINHFTAVAAAMDAERLSSKNLTLILDTSCKIDHNIPAEKFTAI